MSIKSKLLAAAGLSNLIASAAAPALGSSTADPVAATPEPADIEGLSAEAQAEVVDAIKAASETGRLAGIAEGEKLANARWSAVMSSDAGKANPGLSAFLVMNSTSTAEQIIEQFSAQTPAPASAAAPAAPTAPAQPTVDSMATDTPAASRDPGNDGLAGEDKIDNAAVFASVDFSGKSSIVEDGLRRPAV